MPTQLFKDNYDDALEIVTQDEGDLVSVIVTERSRDGRGPSEAEFHAKDAHAVGVALIEAAGGHGASYPPFRDHAVEFVLHLSNGSRFYTGGFEGRDEIWRIVNGGGVSDSLAGTFDKDAEHADRWSDVQFERGAVIAIEDVR